MGFELWENEVDACMGSLRQKYQGDLGDKIGEQRN